MSNSFFRRHRATVLGVSIGAVVVIGGWMALNAMYRQRDAESQYAHRVDLEDAPDLRFAWAEGGMGKYDILVVSADGTASYTFHNGPHYPTPSNPDYVDASTRRAQFVLDAQTMVELRELLAAVNYWRMHRAYGSNVHDGTQRYFRVDASGRRKLVYCDNNFPSKAVRISQFVRKRILANQTAAIQGSSQIDSDAYFREMDRFRD